MQAPFGQLMSDSRMPLGPQPSLQGRFRAILFDCDGVLVDSRSACRATWQQWAERIGAGRKLDVSGLEGRPVREAMASLVPPDKLDAEVEWFESRELVGAGRVRALPGALKAVHLLGPRDWAIVTSASRALAEARLTAAGLPIPGVLVSADDVQNGKPAPDCYSLAASLLNVRTRRCLAIEDSRAGIAAASRAGATVLAIADGDGYGAVHIGPVADLRYVQLTPARGEIQLRLLSEATVVGL